MRNHDLELIRRLENETGVKLERFPGSSEETLPENGFDVDSYGYVYILTIKRVELGSLPPFIPEFAHLHTLIVRDAQLEDISCLKGLKTLTRLNLSNNKIRDISSLTDLAWLNRLYLNGNLVSDISCLTRLKKLKTLDLRDNIIAHLPPDFLALGMEIKWGRAYTEDEEGIFLVGNPLESPPMEIIKKGDDAIKAYFKSLE